MHLGCLQVRFPVPPSDTAVSWAPGHATIAHPFQSHRWHPPWAAAPCLLAAGLGGQRLLPPGGGLALAQALLPPPICGMAQALPPTTAPTLWATSLFVLDVPWTSTMI